ncbi:hypothetical protein [Sporosarcina jiandibaonis]|uniref:hypothetical protein n=1 Tax=Sporosarcina jiandibaonis TaxID=2715535 RepID=UPI00155343FE|nr:hypothetical protein [Sporosarcina jiandibaonis]
MAQLDSISNFYSLFDHAGVETTKDASQTTNDASEATIHLVQSTNKLLEATNRIIQTTNEGVKENLKHKKNPSRVIGKDFLKIYWGSWIRTNE